MKKYIFYTCMYFSFYHVTYAFQSESTLYSCLNVKDVLARNSLAKWLSVRLRTKWLWICVQVQSLNLQIGQFG